MNIKSQKDFFSGLLFMGVGVAFAVGANNYSVGNGARMGAAVYEGEDNVVQGGANITSLGYSAAIATQAFDEPLAADKVLAIAGLFIV